jgi:hypothetical protein
MIRMQISLTEQQQEALRRLAALRRRSQAAVLRDALEEIVADDARLRRVERVRALAGRYGSGDARSVTEHDAMLAEIWGGDGG